MYNKDLGKYWDKKWTKYAEKKNNEFAEEVPKILSPSINKPTVKLLDIGCGDGRDIKFFSKQGYDITTFDISMSCVNNITKNFKDVKVSYQDIRCMNFKKNSYDIIYAHLTLHYFYDKETTKIFDKIYDFLKPDGYFFVKCKSIKDFHYGEGRQFEENCYATEGKHLRHFFTEKYMKEKLKKFKIKEIKETESIYNTQKSAFIKAIAIK